MVRVSGQVNPLVSSAARTRSRASRHDVSGRPTTVKHGRPRATWTSTVTGMPSTPTRVADGTVASMGCALLQERHAGAGSGGRPEATERR